LFLLLTAKVVQGERKAKQPVVFLPNRSLPSLLLAAKVTPILLKKD
jgi:hypothetical protein